MGTPELKPCPFCGGEARAFTAGGADWASEVQCRECNASSECHETPEDAAEVWNRRAPVEITEEATERFVKRFNFLSHYKIRDVQDKIAVEEALRAALGVA